MFRLYHSAFYALRVVGGGVLRRAVGGCVALFCKKKRGNFMAGEAGGHSADERGQSTCWTSLFFWKRKVEQITAHTEGRASNEGVRRTRAKHSEQCGVSYSDVTRSDTVS